MITGPDPMWELCITAIMCLASAVAMPSFAAPKRDSAALAISAALFFMLKEGKKESERGWLARAEPTQLIYPGTHPL